MKLCHSNKYPHTCKLCSNWDNWATHQRVRLPLSPVGFGSEWAGTSGPSAQPRDAAALHRGARLHGITRTHSLIHQVSDLRAAGYRFEPRPRHRPSWLWFIWVFLTHSLLHQVCDLRAAGYRFEPRPRHRPSWLWFIWVFSVSPGKCRDHTSIYTATSLFTVIQPELLEACQVKQIVVYPERLIEVLSERLSKGLKKWMFLYCGLLKVLS
jgi:hypothetical protein